MGGKIHGSGNVSNQDPPAVSQASHSKPPPKPTPASTPAIPTPEISAAPSKIPTTLQSAQNQATKQLQVSKSPVPPLTSQPSPSQQIIQPPARISAAYLEAVFNENAYLDSLSPEVWLEMMPASKRELLRWHHLLHQGTASESRQSLSNASQQT